ncbi:MAG TPA: hypothetical protein VGI85_13425 [Chthoniobacterales bacterium]|jgi:hypothetical protein
MNTLRIRPLCLLVGALVIASAIPRTNADIVLYGSTGSANSSGGGRLYQIDVTTQTVSLIGDTGFDRLGGIAFNSSGVLYGVSGGSSVQSTLLTIDPTTGAASVIGLVSDPNAAIDGLRFDAQDVLYGSAFRNDLGVGVLVTIDPSNADILSSLTLMGSGNSFCAGIAFDPTGALYASRGNASGRNEDLALVNQTTGSLTAVGGLDTVLSDIVFDTNGTLYGSSPNGDLYSINSSTGAKTFLFNTGIAQFSGLAAPIPEPSVFVLFVFAALGLFVVLRRNRLRSGAK